VSTSNHAVIDSTKRYSKTLKTNKAPRFLYDAAAQTFEAPATTDEAPKVASEAQKGDTNLRKGERSYIGDLVDGVRHGQGVLTYESGETLRGEFLHGRIHNGTGTLKYASSQDIRKGTWVDGKMQGQGSTIIRGWSFYVGNFKDGMKHGDGVMTFTTTGEILRGEFRNGYIYNGEGVVRMRQAGDYMIGKWKRGEMHGKGVACKDGWKYEGEFENGLYHGQGVLTYSTGKTLSGTFVKGTVQNGTGHLKVKGSADYATGTWVDGVLDGPGTTFTAGLMYEGNFRAGEWHGQGVVTYPTCETLKGEFRKGKIFNGEGTLKQADSANVMSGTWVNGKLHGPGVTNTGGWRYEGQLDGGEWHGQGVLTYETGEMLKGEFVRGRIHNGGGVLRSRGSGEYLIGMWLGGALQGQGTTATSRWTYVGEHKDGQPHGKGVQTFATGEVLRGEFREGKIYTGKGDFVYTNSGDTRSGKWVDGVMTGYGKITTEGFCVYQGGVKDGVKHGKGVLRYATGEEFRGEFRDGKVHSGKGCIRARAGGVCLTGRWVDGKIVGRGVKSMEGVFTYEGTFSEGRYHGQGVLTQKDGEVLRGEFRHGKVYNGEGVRRLQNGTLLKGTWEKGVFSPAVESSETNAGEVK
jgi:hypothetical protein